VFVYDIIMLLNEASWSLIDEVYVVMHVFSLHERVFCFIDLFISLSVTHNLYVTLVLPSFIALG